jgi:hypothetical protein
LGCAKEGCQVKALNRRHEPALGNQHRHRDCQRFRCWSIIGGSAWTSPCGKDGNNLNSSTARVMSLFLLPWAESRQRNVTFPSERTTSLLLEMAT